MTKILKDAFLHLGVPGAYTGPYTGEPNTRPVNYTFITRYKQWHVCTGRNSRSVCIIHTGDLWGQPVMMGGGFSPWATGHLMPLFRPKAWTYSWL